MKRCTEHDLLNCKCYENLSTFLVRQFSESGRDRVARVRSWSACPDAGRADWNGAGADRRKLRSIAGGKK